MAPVSVSGLIPVDHHQYLLVEDELWAPESPASVEGNGLVEVRPGGVTVLAGMQYGDLAIVVEPHEVEPPVEAGEWDEIVDVSVPGSLGRMVFCDVMGVPVDGLPNAAWRGPGDYRIRVRARGRDAAARHAYDDPPPDPPLEQHVVQIWPAPPSDPVVHKLTDRIGATLRGEPAEDGTTPPPIDVSEAAHRAIRELAADVHADQLPALSPRTTVLVEDRVVARRPADVFRYVRYPANWLAKGGSPATEPGERFRARLAPPYRLDARGELLDVRPNRTVTFSWALTPGIAPDPVTSAPAPEYIRPVPDPAMTITTRLRRDQDDTIITISSEGVPVEWASRIRALWTLPLPKISSALVGASVRRARDLDGGRSRCALARLPMAAAT